MAEENTQDMERQSDESNSTTSTGLLACLVVFAILGITGFCFDLYDFITTVKNNQATKGEKILNGFLISATVFSFCGLCELLREHTLRAYYPIFVQSLGSIILAILNLTGKNPFKK